MQKREKGQKLREKERSCCSQCFYCVQLFKRHAKKIHWYKEKTLSLLSNRKETEEEEVMDEGGGAMGGVKLRRMRTLL